MDRIIIALTELSRENWGIIYRFIKSIVRNEDFDKRLNAFLEISKVAYVRLSNVSSNYICSLDGIELTKDRLNRLSSSVYYNVLYQKQTDVEDFTELVPLILLQHEFGEIISLGIELYRLSQQDYYYKCRNFFFLLYKAEPKLIKNLYFIEENVNKITGVMEFGSKRLVKEEEESRKNNMGEPSRRFLPLIQITRETYKTIFCSDISIDTIESKFIEESEEKIKKELKNNFHNNEGTAFSKWLEYGYFYSYDSKEQKKINFNEIINTIRVYTNSIFELVQNVIFHGGGEGLIYCVFDKKENISSVYHDKIPFFNDFGNDDRFLRIGLFDYSKCGIVETYENDNKNDIVGGKLSLIDFFDAKSIATTGLTKLEKRYAAQLGIKQFVKTIIKNNGYFYIESNCITGNKSCNKEALHTMLDKNTIRLDNIEEFVFTDGTHYEIILPITKNKENASHPYQQKSFFFENSENQLLFLLDKSKKIKNIKFPLNSIGSIVGSENKENQKKAIINVSNSILNSLKQDGNSYEGLVFDMEAKEIDPILVFKIISYLQLTAQNGFGEIIIANATDSFVDSFYELVEQLVEPGDENVVWSQTSSIILISIYLRTRIIWGKTGKEFYYINQELRRKYYNNFFTLNSDKEYNTNIIVDEATIDKARCFIQPYDIIVINKNQTSLFEEFIPRILVKEIISPQLGFLVNHNYTYIGNKIILNSYYEADMLFQNNFFAERFAYLIARNIYNKCKLQDVITTEEKRPIDEVKFRRKLVLIGYKQYSEFLLKDVRRLLPDKNNVFTIVANENIDSFDFDNSFNFDVGLNGEGFKDTILSNITEYVFATIVPIGSTLSTNDKIISFFKQWYRREFEKKKEKEIDRLEDYQFFYNHCVIVVRDKVGTSVTKIEREQKWKEVDQEKHIIRTEYTNAKSVHYNVQIALKPNYIVNTGDFLDGENKKQRDDNENSNNWVKRLNREISFPKNWWREKYVNYTENSSINSQNLMGFPLIEKKEKIYHYEELPRLYEFWDSLYKGHIDVLGCHHKYYIDTESFIKWNGNGIEKWLRDLNIEQKGVFVSDKLNVIITPNAEYESDFISAVNRCVFGGDALIVYLDVKNWRNNIVYKLSFLKALAKNKRACFHYVDHALLSGETYQKSRSYLFSIVESSNFESIITIVNRLSYAKYQRILNDDKVKLFAYVNLHYPSNEGEQDCELCKLVKYYDDLEHRTVLDSCSRVIQGNKYKLMLRQKSEFRQKIRDDKVNVELTDDERKANEWNRRVRKKIKTKRDFLRLILTHELYYLIAESVAVEANTEAVDWGKSYDEMERNLDAFFRQLCNDYSVQSQNNKFCQLIDERNRNNLFSNNSVIEKYSMEKHIVDKRIAFLKVISSPPLSQYIVIRKYAYKKLLYELHSVIEKSNSDKETVTYDDLKVVKAVLKSLSFLKSNALVRRDVIVGVWSVLLLFLENKEREIGKINDVLKNLEEAYIQKKSELIIERQKIVNDPQGDLFDTPRKNLDMIDKELKDICQFVNDFRDIIEYELSCIKQGTLKIIQDFSRDVPFFVKNAIVEDDAKATFLGELLRSGSEIVDFDGISINKTNLYLEKNKSGNDNDIFHYFDDVANKAFKEEYKNFLMWLFYDNTTIIRKTHDHFEKELSKDAVIHKLFYEKDKGNERLVEVKDFKNNISIAKEAFSKKVETEYYYHSFRPYLINGDEIDYVEKLIYVTYARLKLNVLTLQKKKTYIESDIRELMEIFTAIMGADAAFWTVRIGLESNNCRVYPISLFGKHENKWDYDHWNLTDSYYTYLVYSQEEIVFPLIPKYQIHSIHREKNVFDIDSLGIFTITLPESQEKNKIVSTITFLFNEDNPVVSLESRFRIHFQESGRLLLLLKNEIESYVIDYLIRDKALNIWEKVHLSSRRFDKIYVNSAHVFNSVYKEMEEFENIEKSAMINLAKTWFFLTNETISFLYSDIEKNISDNGKEHFLNLKERYIIDKNNTLGQTFNDKFISILTELLGTRWMAKNDGNDKKNEIFINNISLEKFRIDDSLKDVIIYCNKHLMRTFVAQCLQNSLGTNSDGNHGHRYNNEIKRVDIILTDNSIKIRDCCVNTDEFPKEAKSNDVRRFRKKRKYITSLMCDDYSSTTLTSLQGFVNYMCKSNIYYKCNFGFNKNNNFNITINFRKNEKDTNY